VLLAVIPSELNFLSENSNPINTPTKPNKKFLLNESTRSAQVPNHFFGQEVVSSSTHNPNHPHQRKNREAFPNKILHTSWSKLAVKLSHGRTV
jgi:hypothetical protein